MLDSGTCCLRIITHQQARLEFALPPVAAQAPAKMVALCFQVASLEQLRRCLSQGDIQWREQDDQLLVTQQHAQWLAMRFKDK